MCTYVETRSESLGEGLMDSTTGISTRMLTRALAPTPIVAESVDGGLHREIGGRDPEDVNRLCLDKAKCNDGLAHLAPFENLVSLSMNDASISSLSSMPALNNLATLKLSDNKIKIGLESLTKLSALEKLCVGGNQIPDLESLDPLNKL